jgi:hypothetical protein
MTEEQIKLARRAVACKGWRFMGGMLLADGVWQARVGEGWRWKEDAELLPVLEDPATLGCLLALVREALNSPHTHVLYVDGLGRWECADRHSVHGSGMTEAEALLDALEAAP